MDSGKRVWAKAVVGWLRGRNAGAGPSAGARVGARVWFAWLAAALAEAVVVGVSAERIDGRFTDGLAGGLLTFGLVVSLALPLALAAAAIFGRAAMLRLGAGLRDGLGAGHPGYALATAAAALAGGLVAGVWAGPRLADRLSPEFALAGTALVALGMMSGLAIGGAQLAGPVASGLGLFAGRFPRAAKVTGPEGLLALAAVFMVPVLATALSAEYAALPAAAVGAWALGRGLAERLATPRRLIVALTLTLLTSAAALVGAEAASPTVRTAMFFRAAYLPYLLTGGQKLLDLDGDGVSGWLLGGDCDDGNAKVKPGAREIPGNGIDENCSGHDAPALTLDPPPPSKRPEGLPARLNLVVLLIDALRPGHLGFAGYRRPTSPALDRFRKGATWFPVTYSATPATRYSLSTMLTGVHPDKLPISSKNPYTLADGATTVAELLDGHGYDRVMYTIDYVMTQTRGIGQGFRVFEKAWGKKSRRWEYKNAAPPLTQAVLGYLEGKPADGSKLYFLLAHYRCPHAPYTRHEVDFGDDDIARYDSAIRHCDDHIGRVLDALAARADADRTAVIVLSDHGEEFGENGHYEHAESISENAVRSLLLARIPGAPIRTVEAPVMLTDVAPTLLDLAGVPLPRGLDGWTLLPLAFGRAQLDAFRHRPIFLHTKHHRGGAVYESVGVLSWPLKYVWDIQTGKRGLYDVSTDPGEHVDLSDRTTERTRREALLESWLATAEPPKTSSKTKSKSKSAGKRTAR